jgi:hypothetical protein
MKATLFASIIELVRSILPAVLSELGHDHKDELAELKAEVAALKAAAAAKAAK